MIDTADKPMVLVVDDAPANIRLLNDLLKNRYHVIFATTGGDALEQAVRFQPALILLDIVMPVMDGYEVCRRLRDSTVTSDIPVIFLSGCTDAEEIVQGFTLGGGGLCDQTISLQRIVGPGLHPSATPAGPAGGLSQE